MRPLSHLDPDDPSHLIPPHGSPESNSTDLLQCLKVYNFPITDNLRVVQVYFHSGFMSQEGVNRTSPISPLTRPYTWFFDKILSSLRSLHICSSLLSDAVINTTSKGTWGRKGAFHLPSYSPSSGEVKAGTWKQKEKQRSGRMLLTDCITTQAHLPKDGTTHSGLGPPTPVSNQEYAPDIPRGQCDGGDSSTKVPPLQMCRVDSGAELPHLSLMCIIL